MKKKHITNIIKGNNRKCRKIKQKKGIDSYKHMIKSNKA